MFDIQLEFAILRDRLRDVLALDCLWEEMLCEAYTDYGYLNCILEYKIMPESTTYESLLEAIEAYEREAKVC